MVHYFSLRKIALATLTLIAIFILIILLSEKEITAWVMGIPAATCLAISYSVLISLFSEQADRNRQGWIMGLTGAISAFSFGITGLFAGLFASLTAATPLWIAFGLVVFSMISMLILLIRFSNITNK